MDLLVLERLKRYYGSFLALATESVALAPGAVGLLGPNGAGKSTLLKILMGLLRPSEGTASVLGLDVVDGSAGIRRRVGYVSENDTIIPGLSAVEYVALAGELTGMGHKDAHRRAHEVLAYLAVEESRYRSVESLSTGVRRRVQLAQALVHDPDLLVLDEPTNGLDPAGRRAMLELIRTLHRDFSKSVILSSHLLDDVDLVCDSVIILDRGKVLAHGRIDVLRTHVRNAYRLRLSGDPGAFLLMLKEAGVAARGEPPQVGDEVELVLELPQGMPLRTVLSIFERSRCRAASVSVPAGNGEGTILRSLWPEQERLQDLFRRIVASGEAEVAR